MQALKVEVVKKFFGPMKRQISETLAIMNADQNKVNLMNRREEWSRCFVPTLKMEGRKDRNPVETKTEKIQKKAGKESEKKKNSKMNPTMLMNG